MAEQLIFTDNTLQYYTSKLTDLIAQKSPSDHDHSYYGVCETAADVAAKTVTISNFKLEVGAMIIVKFTNVNSAASPTLNVNGTGAKPMYRYGTTAISTSASTSGWRAGAVQLLVYDGTGWIRHFWENSTYSNASLGQGYGTCTTAASTVAKVGSLSSYTLSTGGIVSIKFTNAVPANATLNINSKGAKSIYYKGAAITANVIKAGDIATFIYSSQYHLISIDRWQDDINNLQSDVNTKSTVSFTRSLTNGTKIGTITINGTGTDLYAPTDTDTHYTTKLKVGASATATANAAATNGNVYLNLLDNSTIRDSHKIIGAGATTVTSDANGVITITSTDNNTTYSVASESASGLMSADDKKKLNGIAANANNYVLPPASSTLGGVKTTSTVTSTSGLTACPIINGIPYYKDTNTQYTLSSFGITATAAQLNAVTGNVSTLTTNLNNHVNNTSNPHQVTKSQVGLTNVENKSSATIRSELTSSNVTTALGYTPLNTLLKGAKGGVAELDANGYVPSSQLPSYVDDVLEYDAKSSFPTTGTTGKIYVDLSNGKIYRWGGSAYVEISASLALGETSSTAYRGDRGKTAYDHSQITGANPHGITPALIGALTSNGTAVKATADASGQTITSTYIKGLSVSGKVITYTFGDGTTGTITTQDTVYTLPTASSTLGGVKTTSTVTSTSGLTACPIIDGVPYYKNSTYSLSSFGITASATELNVLDGITATVTELNYTDGVTSNIQTQLNNKAAKATTLSGYGITNAYTKAEIDAYSFITVEEIDAICNG